MPSLSENAAYGRAKKQLVGASALVAVGLAVAGSIDRTAGGVLLLTGWVAALAALHRLGRSGPG